jgi:Predicted metal binding domain
VSLVDPAISRRKLDRELDAFAAQAEDYRRRGYVVVGRDDLNVDVAFFAHVPAVPAPLPIVSVCVRLDFTNYDLWPPSLTFIDVITGTPIQPHVAAINYADPPGPDGVRPNVVVNGHRRYNGRPFYCQRGVREYHDHDEHDGDDWLLYRSDGLGELASLCQRIWQRMAQNVAGLQFQSLLAPPPIDAVLPQTLIVQVDRDMMRADLMNQLQAQGAAHAQTEVQGGSQLPGFRR